MSKLITNDGDFISSPKPEFSDHCAGFTKGDGVWAFNRGDWRPAIITSMRQPTPDKPRFGVIDLNTGREYITDHIMSYTDFLTKVPSVSLATW